MLSHSHGILHSLDAFWLSGTTLCKPGGEHDTIAKPCHWRRWGRLCTPFPKIGSKLSNFLNMFVDVVKTTENHQNPPTSNRITLEDWLTSPSFAGSQVFPGIPSAHLPNRPNRNRPNRNRHLPWAPKSPRDVVAAMRGVNCRIVRWRTQGSLEDFTYLGFGWRGNLQDNL